MTSFPIRTSTTLFKLTLLGLPLLLAACSNSDSTPPTPETTLTAPASSSPAATLEAEQGQTLVLPGTDLSAQAAVEPGAPTGGQVISDSNASGGQAVSLLSTGSAVRFTVPAGAASGNYTVRVQGRAVAYNGNPIVAVQLNGSEKGRVELTTTSYSAFTVGTFALKAGDVLTVVFTNDAYGGTPSTDRNAVVDYLILDPASTGSTSGGTAVKVDAVPGAGARTSGSYVTLLGNGATANLTVPTGVSGTYRLQLQAKGDVFQGEPVVEVRKGGAVLGKVTVGATAGLYDVGNLSLQPGDQLNVVFVNDYSTGPWPNDRNAMIDYGVFTPVTTAAPAPVAAPTPTPTPAPTPTATVTTGTDVKTFGARGDGRTDDTAALQRAADSKQSLYFPAGTYVVSKPVVFNSTSGQVITGDPAALIKISSAWNNGGANFGALTFRNPTNLTVKSLAFKGFTNLGDTWGSSRQEGIQVYGGSNVTFDGITVDSAHSFGINGDDVSGYKVTGSKMTYIHGSGIGCGNCTNVVVSGNYVTGTADPSTPMDQGNNTSGIGIFLQNGSGALIENNTIKNQWDTATKTEGMSNVTYRGNTVDTFGKDAIKVMYLPNDQGGSGQVVKNALIENNVVRNFTHWRYDGTGGLLVAGVDGATLRGNTVYGPGKSIDSNGITVASFSDNVPQNRNVTVEDNTVFEARRGMVIKSDTATVARRNRFSSTSGAMTRCVDLDRGNGTVLEDNTFEGFTNICVLAYNSIDNITLQRNTYKSGQAGLWLNANDSTGFKVLSNSFENVPEPLPYQGTVAQCSGNTGTGVRSECR
ncbi:hypothetical protein DAETH_33580 (plasmid) [Deinococcus aetherius]|uniref:Uncharacterized protein n=1 Tax=Deinococcus aetherius TaxID=200252 RepID=A0ABM8AHV1_9DEIO|nr:right-handed parallel beta-helix repeat-containing protein [Deinococcus aetherius]BDP43389.1 hypothetical protein DAETH_33580 [Deinococcus aetherius]